MRLVDRYRAFAVDLDGVVWRGDELLEGGIAGLKTIIEAAKPFLLLTNNGSYEPAKVSERLAEAGLSVRPDQLLSSTIVAHNWIIENGFEGKAAFVLGNPDVVAQVKDVVEVLEIKRGASADMVLVGRYTGLSYDRLATAAEAIRGGAAFIALNNDPIMPVEDGFVPGTGAIVAALRAASGGEPVVLGKPERPMMDQAGRILGGEGILMIGDRPQSDIEGARRMGWDSALVMSGISNRDSKLEPEPTYLLESLADIALSQSPSL